MSSSLKKAKITGITLLVLCIISIADNVAALIISPLFIMRLGAVFGLLSCALALYYMFKGFKKEAALSYKLFMIVMFLTFQLATISAGLNIIDTFGKLSASITVLVWTLMAAFAFTLALGRDMGKKLSKGISLTIGVVATLQLFFMLFFTPGTLRGGPIEATTAILCAASIFFVAWMSTAMVWAKYKDKALRGAK